MKAMPIFGIKYLAFTSHTRHKTGGFFDSPGIKFQEQR